MASQVIYFFSESHFSGFNLTQLSGHRLVLSNKLAWLLPERLLYLALLQVDSPFGLCHLKLILQAKLINLQHSVLTKLNQLLLKLLNFATQIHPLQRLLCAVFLLRFKLYPQHSNLVLLALEVLG